MISHEIVNNIGKHVFQGFNILSSELYNETAIIQWDTHIQSWRIHSDHKTKKSIWISLIIQLISAAFLMRSLLILHSYADIYHTSWAPVQLPAIKTGIQLPFLSPSIFRYSSNSCSFSKSSCSQHSLLSDCQTFARLEFPHLHYSDSPRDLCPQNYIDTAVVDLIIAV